MQIIDTSLILHFTTYTKTKPMRVISMADLFQGNPVMSQFKLTTIEGDEQVDPQAWLCQGESGDVWQQKYTKLVQKYELYPVGINWYSAFPKPDNKVKAVQLTNDLIELFELDIEKPVFIRGNYGEPILGYDGLYQRAVLNSWIVVRLPEDGDQWIVQDKLFINTYSPV